MFLAGIAVRRSVYNPDLSQTSMYSKIAVHQKPLVSDTAELGSDQDTDIKGASSWPVNLCSAFLNVGGRIRPRIAGGVVPVVWKWDWLLPCYHQKYLC